MFFFSQFFGVFLGWLIVVHLGLEGLGVFVFLVFVFLLCVAFVSVLFALFLVLWLDVVVLFFFVSFCFGPPHLALNPPYFICFCFFVSPLFSFLFCFFFVFLFVF